MARGPKKGSMQKASLTRYLSSFDSVGAVDILELDSVEECVAYSRRISAKSRYPQSMDGWSFATQSIHGVPSGKFGQSIYLLKVERVT